MKKSTLIMILCLVLAVALGVGGTLAYLQDTDEDVNVMALGNVYIEQIELERKDGVEHTGVLEDGDLVDFVQGKPLYPAVDTTENKTGYTAEPTELLYWGPYVTAEGAGNGLWKDELQNAQDKFVFVKNTGTSNAYYRTVFAFECPVGVEFSENSDKELMMNVNGGTQFFDWQEIGYATIDGVRYLLQVATYQKELLPGEISRPSLLQVVLTHNATNEDVELLGETYDILVVSQAVQTQGFENAQQALDTAFGPITADNNPWKKNGEDLDDTPAFPVMVSTADELVAAIAAGGDVYLTDDIDIGEEAIVIAKDNEVTLNLNGKKLTGANDSADSCYMIDNKGKLTINGDGVIDFASTCDASGSIGDGYYTITNTGDLTINGGVIKNSSNDGWLVGGGMGKIATAIDHKAGNLTINDGTIESTYRSLRIAPFGGNVVAEINGGKFVGQVWVQNLNGSKTSVLTVNGGEYGPVGSDGSSIFVDNSDGKATAVINDGIFNTKIGANALTEFVKGGTFATQDAYNKTNAALFAADNTVTVK